MSKRRRGIAHIAVLCALGTAAVPVASANDFVYRYKMSGGGAAADGLAGKGTPPADLVTVRFPSFVANATTGRVSDVTFTQGTRSVKPIYVKASGGPQTNAQALVDGDPTTVWTGGTDLVTTVGFKPGDAPDGARLGVPGPDGPGGATFKPSGDGGSTFGEGMFSPMLGPWGNGGGEETMPTKPTAPGGSGVNLPASKGWKKVFGPVSPGAGYNRGTKHFTGYYISDPSYCGLGGQALAGGRNSKEAALSNNASPVDSYIMAAETWIIDNPSLTRYQHLEIWIKQ